MESELSYLKRRADQERMAAVRADTPQARIAHQALARRYERLMTAANTDSVEGQGWHKDQG